MASAAHRSQAWKHVQTGVWVIVGVGLVVAILSHLSWHDYVELRDGRRGRALALPESPHTFMVQIDDAPTPVAMGDIAVLKPGVGRLMLQANVRLLMGAILLTLLVPFLHAVRMQLLLDGLQIAMRRARVLAVCLLGYVVNVTALGSAGGEVYRAMTLRQDAMSWERILTCLLADRVIGLAVLVTGTAVGSLWYVQHAVFGTLARWIVGAWLGGATIGVVGLWLGRRPWLGPRVDRLLPGRLREGWALLRSGGASRPQRAVLTQALLVSVAIQAANLGAMALMGYAFGFEYAFEAALLVMPIATILSLVIPTPQGFGVIEGVLIAVLASSVSGGANMCALFALGVRLLRILWALPGVLLLVGRCFFPSTAAGVTPGQGGLGSTS